MIFDFPCGKRLRPVIRGELERLRWLGEYGHSLSTLDVFSQWWEREVVMGRAQVRIFNALKELEVRSPFAWRSVHSDNDNAFINEMLYCYTQDQGIGFARSRPYRKNDNAYIEQKNFTLVMDVKYFSSLATIIITG